MAVHKLTNVSIFVFVFFHISSCFFSSRFFVAARESAKEKTHGTYLI